MKTIKDLFGCGLVFVMAILAIASFGVAVWSLVFVLDASAYNEAELAKAQQNQPLGTLPTLVPQREVIPIESFQLLPDENAPVAFVRNAETFTLLGPAPTVESLVVAGQTVAEPAPTVPPLPSVVGISIPSILGPDGVDPLSAVVEPVFPVQDQGGGWHYGTPKENVGWHSGSGRPGGGRAIEFNGHIRWYGTDGVFRYLSTVSLDDEIVLKTKDGGEHRYTVRQILTFPYDTTEGRDYIAQLEARGEELVIAITCVNWSAEKQIYLDRLIVVAVKPN